MPYVAPNLSFNTALLFSQETAIGTAVAATGLNTATWTAGRYAGPALLDNAFTPAQQDVKLITTNPVRQSMTKRKDIVGRSIVTITFDAFLQGNGGSGGQMPWWVPLVESCGHSLASGTSGGSSSWVLTPTNTPPSLTFYHHSGGIRQLIHGAFGTVQFKFPAGDAPRMSFTFKGIWNQPTDVAFPTLTNPGFYAAQVQSESFVINALNSLIVPEITFDLAAEQQEREDINSALGFYGFFHADRNPKVTAMIEKASTLASGIDVYTLQQNQTDCDLSWTHGTVAGGSQVVFSVPDSQLTVANEQERNKRKIYNCTFKGQNTAENGDYLITVKEKI